MAARSLEALHARLRRLARRLRHFQVIEALAPDIEGLRPLAPDELAGDLGTAGPTRGRFLQRFTVDQLERGMEANGTLDRIRERGLDPRLALHGDAQGRYLLRVHHGAADEGPVLIELAARFARIAPRHQHDVDDPHGGGGRGQGRAPRREQLDALLIDWVLLQDPTRSFGPERPRLPGQAHPGLGGARCVLENLDQLARALGRDALLGFPVHYHTASLFSPALRFLDARRQGQLEALDRDLAPLGLHAAAWAVAAGHVRPQGADEPLVWVSEEMVRPLNDRAADLLEGGSYGTRVAEERARQRFEVDREGLDETLARVAKGEDPLEG